MADLGEIVDLYACSDAGFADAGAVYAGVGLDLHGVFKNGRTGLHDLVPCSRVVFGKAEAVAADDSSVLQNDMVAETAVFADDGMGVGERNKRFRLRRMDR